MAGLGHRIWWSELVQKNTVINLLILNPNLLFIMEGQMKRSVVAVVNVKSFKYLLMRGVNLAPLIFKNMTLEIPIAVGAIFWNGRPDEFSNLPGSLSYSQPFGETPFSKSGVYGYYKGEPRPHNGHDFAGPKGIPLVAPLDCQVSYVGWDEKGYGNFVFFEAHGIEFVLAHMNKKAEVVVGQKLKRGDLIGFMGSTGLSTGPHTHFAGRPIGVSKDNPYRGYIDLTKYFRIKPIYDKQELLNNYMQVIKKKGEANLYAVDSFGKANQILNWSTYQLGLTMGLWESDKIDSVEKLPDLGSVIILTPDN